MESGAHDLLAEVEARVARLIERLEALQEENARLRRECRRLHEERAALETAEGEGPGASEHVRRELESVIAELSEV